jgi:hypothetical protein
MAGTQHFHRIRYNVRRGLREIIASRQTLPETEWAAILHVFQSECAYCGQPGTFENRGIVADHLVPAHQFGELVGGNVLPACQHCNDTRGRDDWRTFVRKKFPGDVDAQIRRIDDFLVHHSYQPRSPEEVLRPDELAEYRRLLADFEKWLRRAKVLRRTVATRSRAEQKEGSCTAVLEAERK